MTLSIASNRKFGVEIEFVGISTQAAIDAISSAGISCNPSCSYNHRNSSTMWKVVTDGSVYDNTGRGSGEVVSPILSGIAGLEQVRKVADAINGAGATSNKTCGLHVHVDARDLNPRDIANVVTRYGKFETSLDEVMPRSRRANHGAYCSSVCSLVAGTDFSRPESFETMSAVQNAWGWGERSRYRKVNLQSYERHGTVEIRHHSGTVQSGKILPWIQFCVNFVEKSRFQTETALRFASGSSSQGRARDSKTLVAYHKIVEQLMGAGFRGCDEQFLSRSVGVSPASVIVYMSHLRRTYGFEIKKSRGRFVLRRHGDLPELTASASTAPIVDARVIPMPSDDSAFRGLPASVISYFEERAVDLAAA